MPWSCMIFSLFVASYIKTFKMYDEMPLQTKCQKLVAYSSQVPYILSLIFSQNDRLMSWATEYIAK